MSRDRTRTRDGSGSAAGDFDVGLEGEAPSQSEPATGSGGVRDRLASRAKRLFDPRQFLVALVLAAVGTFVAGNFVPLLPATGLLGLFVATFVFGLVARERRYAEAAVAGGVVTAASLLLDFLVISALGGYGLPLAAVGGALGAVVAVAGTYFGRDLRHGLTRDVT